MKDLPSFAPLTRKRKVKETHNYDIGPTDTFWTGRVERLDKDWQSVPQTKVINYCAPGAEVTGFAHNG